MENLTDIYGHCIIPKGTLLFRGHNDNSFKDCMFFATKYWVAKGFSNNSTQVWKTTKDIHVIFLVEFLDNISHTISTLPTLYNRVFSSENNPNFTDLDIKHWDICRRNKLVRKLFDDYKISGWFTSIENNVELEVCLFDTQANSEQLILIETCGSNNENYFKDSLRKMKLFPTENFYTKTTEQLNSMYEDNFQLYRKKVNSWIKEAVENGGNKVRAKNSYYDLRTKLKI